MCNTIYKTQIPKELMFQTYYEKEYAVTYQSLNAVIK